MPTEYLETTLPVVTGLKSRLNVSRALGIGTQLAGGFVIAALVFPFVSPATRRAFAQRWAERMIRGLGARLCVEGAEPVPGALFVANHVSWLDILVITACLPVVFIAKSEVRTWPAIGWLAACAETVFLRRSSGRSLLQVKDRVGTLLLEGRDVALFAEGTTSSGPNVLPFRSGLMQAAVDSDRPVQAIAVAYYGDDGRRSAAAAFVDNMTLLQSTAAVLRCGSITARLVFAPPLAPAGRTRKQLAREAHGLVVALLARPLRESDIHKICA